MARTCGLLNQLGKLREVSAGFGNHRKTDLFYFFEERLKCSECPLVALPGPTPWRPEAVLLLYQEPSAPVTFEPGPHSIQDAAMAQVDFYLQSRADFTLKAA